MKGLLISVSAGITIFLLPFLLDSTIGIENITFAGILTFFGYVGGQIAICIVPIFPLAKVLKEKGKKWYWALLWLFAGSIIVEITKAVVDIFR